MSLKDKGKSMVRNRKKRRMVIRKKVKRENLKMKDIRILIQEWLR